jgi:site-specific DNA recombinase
MFEQMTTIYNKGVNQENPMQAVIYARYSTDKQRDTSIDDQVRNCRAFAKREGWEVTEIYSDGGISGSTNQRSGYQQLLADADAGRFTVLIVDDLSRLSRDDVEMKQVVRRFRFKQMRIVGVSDGFDTDSKGHKIHAGVRGLINEIYLDDLRDKTHRGLTGQALKGYSCGGRAYGYKNIPIEDPSRKDEYGRPVIVAVKREVEPEQAKWIRQIFEWYADGHSPRWIANEMNKAGVPSMRKGKWASSAIYGDMRNGTGLLNNELYIGRYVWNRSQWVKDPDCGKRRRLGRLESEWIVTSQPELRIVSDELWNRVKARQKHQHDKSISIRTALHNNARTGAGPKYLFSGMLKCGCCGGNYILVDYYRYGCAVHKDRGEHACFNKLKVPRLLLESRLLGSIKHDLFTPEWLAWFQKETTRLIAEKRKQHSPNLEQLKKRLVSAEQTIENVMKAIRAGIITQTTKEELQKAESERNEVKVMLDAGIGKKEGIPVAIPHVAEIFNEKIGDLENIAQQRMAFTRKHVGGMVGDEITLRPTEEGGLTAELYGYYAGLLEFVSGKSKLNLVAGARFELTTFRL